MNRSIVPAELVADFRALEAIASRSVSTAGELASNLDTIYGHVLGVDLDRYDVRVVKTVAPSLMQSIFETRIKLRSQIADWNARGLLDGHVQRSLRNVFRVSRYAVDMLGELNIGFERSAVSRRAFAGGQSMTHVNPAYYDGRDIAFSSGDVLLVRGNAHNSAAIARIGDVDSQFSHMAIVHVDANGKAWVVEALIEVGCVVTPLAEFLDHGLGRAVLYRPRDSALGAAASKWVYDWVGKSRRPWRRPIPYDFTFDLNSYDAIFCSKLIRQAYDKGSAGKYILPTFTTRLDMKNRDFFDRVGATAAETFAPGDIDLEPGFDLVAEWQDYRQTSRLRLQDLMMDKIFDWMERYGWRFQETALVRAVSLLGKAASYLSEDAKNLLKDTFPRVPSNMSRRTVAVIAMLHKTGEELMAGLTALEENCIRMHGRPAHPREVFSYLETVRETSNGAIGYLVGPGKV